MWDVIVCNRKTLDLITPPPPNPLKSYIHNDNQYRKIPGATGTLYYFSIIPDNTFLPSVTNQTPTSHFKWPYVTIFFIFSHQCIRVGGLKWHRIKYTYLSDGLLILQWSIHSSSPTILWNLSSKPSNTKIKKPTPHTYRLEMSVHRSCWFLFQMQSMNFWILGLYLLFCSFVRLEAYKRKWQVDKQFLV